MIQYIQCIKGKDQLTIPDFRRAFDEYGRMMRAIANRIGAERVEVSTTLAVEANLTVMLDRGTGLPFDGVVEIYIPSAREMAERLAHPDVAPMLQALQRFQEEFIDLESSRFFFASAEG